MLNIYLVTGIILWGFLTNGLSQDCATQRPGGNDFSKTTVIGNISNETNFEEARYIMEIAFTNDGSMFFVVKEGHIGLVDNNDELSLVHILDVYDQGDVMGTEGQGYESGLRGIAVDPDFENNYWIYVIYDENKTEQEYLTKQELLTKVVRLTFNPQDKTIVNGSEKTLLTWMSNGIDHVAGSMAFGPDGVLHILSGDDTDSQSFSQFAPLNWAPDKNPEDPCRKFTAFGGRESGSWVAQNSPCASDASRSTANTNDLRGKTLRIIPIPFADSESPEEGVGTTYSIPEGNLFPVGTDKTRPEIYTMGHRAGWRLNIDSRTKWVYIGEGGPAAGGTMSNGFERGPVGHEELNIAHKASFFGWPYFNGNNEPYRPWDFETNTPLSNTTFFDPTTGVTNGSPRNTGMDVLPVAQPAAIWQSRPNAGSFSHSYMDRGGCVISSGPRYYYGDYPTNEQGATKLSPYYHEKLFFSDVNGGYIGVATIEHNTDRDIIEVVEIEDFTGGTFNGWMLDFEISPDGALYGVSNGSVSKIAYTGDCRVDDALDVNKNVKAPEYIPATRLAVPGNLIRFPEGKQTATLFTLEGRQVLTFNKVSENFRVPLTSKSHIYLVKFD